MIFETLKNKKMILIYKEKKDGTDAKDFHGKCDNQGEIITIVKVEDKVFGGYSNIDWYSERK